MSPPSRAPSNDNIYASYVASAGSVFPEMQKVNWTLMGGSGGGGDDMETRVAKLEAEVSAVHRTMDDVKSDIRGLRQTTESNFKWLLGSGAAAVVLTLGVLAKGFGWL